MSNINLKWLSENLKPNAIIFDIGAGDLHDTCLIKAEMPSATFYAFECSKSWEESNKIVAVEYGINYFHIAVSDIVGTLTFYPSSTLNGQEWLWSGSICEPGIALLNKQWKWGNSYTVNSTTLNKFCSDYNVNPDFIHIDIQGAEYKAFSAIGHYRPTIVWAEINEFDLYKTETTYDKFHTLMESLGYTERFNNNLDALYVLKNMNIEDYKQKN